MLTYAIAALTIVCVSAQLSALPEVINKFNLFNYFFFAIFFLSMQCKTTLKQKQL